METNELKKLIGKECMVLDPRSKKKEFKPATILSVNVNIGKMRYKDDSLYECISFFVELQQLTISKKKFVGSYRRSFNVSNDRISLL